MNKPKFRAWDKEAEKMIYQADNGDEYVWMIGADEIWVERINEQKIPEQILMQYTGLKDKNGVEACQGNYLTREGRWTFFIEWLDEYGCLMAVPVNPIQRINWEPVPIKKMLEAGFVNDGNIHENPELLNEVE